MQVFVTTLPHKNLLPKKIVFELLIDPERSYNILLTSGMSLMEMNIDVETDLKDQLKFAELLLLIPKEIKFEKIHTGSNSNDWIVSMVKQTARFPHHYDTWLGVGHSVQANEENTPYSDATDFCGLILLPSATLSDDFMKIERDGRIINFYSLFPLYKNELEFKREKGYDAFWDALVKDDTKDILDNKRPNLFRKKWFGLF